MGHAHHHPPRKKAALAYLAATLFGVLAFVIQMYGGHGSHSSGLMADAFHVAADAWFNLVSCWALFVRKPQGRPGLFPGIALAVVGIVTINLAYGKLHDPRIENVPLMLITASIGLMINVAMLSVLKVAGAGHLHAHGHAHHESNVKHVVADLLSSVAVTATAALFLLFPATPSIFYADPIIALAIGLWLIVQGLHMLKNR